ncbi:MAG: 50S ribosomal protein L21 [Gammaproteobacteria bacterium]|nr:50S ribosomal protein L21 [Gammaproteobacteria bacterium]
MYAVIKSGGKQYRVKEGQTLKLEKLELEVGATLNFDQVLMIANGDDIKVGAPFLTGSTVEASVIGQGRRDKIHIIKFRRRKHHQKQMGHRQYYTEVKITGISAGK